MVTAQQIMSRNFVLVQPNTNIAEAVTQMLEQNASLIFAVDACERVIGVLPDSIILRAAVDRHLRQDPVSLHVVRQFASLSIDAPIDAVIDTFVLHDRMTMPVVHGQRVQGIIGRLDLLHQVPDFLPSESGDRAESSHYL